MSEQLTVHDPSGNPVYEIMIEKDFEKLAAGIREAGLHGRRVCVVSDSKTAPLYADIVCRQLEEISVQTELFVFPEGERSKTLDTVRSLYAFLIEKKFDRNDYLAALGGGVVGDLTGFAAATYLRGISFIQIPTTLLAQSDSSVGGKTGVDFDGYKNMVGAFCMPKLVYMNVSTLRTLDTRTYLSGLGEVIKHGYIRDREFLNFILTHQQEILERDPETLMKLDLGNCRIKRSVVEEDPTEKGLRGILNFGHTLGHAIEKQLASSLYHGECVSIGMVAAAYISYLKGYLSLRETEEMKQALTGFSLPINAAFDLDAALEATKNDKKMKNGTIRFALLSEIGDAFLDQTVTLGEMRQGLEYVWSPSDADLAAAEGVN
ncbi:MAG: 3-dehydroquinate synthase [Lachnospiraceae bacterium]|nr:3-dehydroquinate synthase [Lachnospiraceae bacterium]